MSSYENLVIFVADALRYDYFPEQLKNGKKVIPTLAPSLHTPTSFTSLHTARSPENHNVRGFMEELDDSILTSFDFFPNCAFYDEGTISSIKRSIFKSGGIDDLEEMDPPFIWVERTLGTHAPYGYFSNEETPNEDIKGSEYLEKARQGEVDIHEDLGVGIENMVEHVQSKIDYLEEEDLLDETLVVITSDHGDALGEKYLGRRRFGHNYPPLREIAQVPTLFYNHEVNAAAMRTIDILPTAFSIMDKEKFGDGVDVREKEIKVGRNIMIDPKASFSTKWVFKDGKWSLTKGSIIKRFFKTILGDVKKRLYNYGGERILEKLEDKKSESNSVVSGIEV